MCYQTIELISHASKVMLKILHASLQIYANQELPEVPEGLQKAEESELKLPISIGSQKKQQNSRKKKKHLVLCWNVPKSLTMWITTNYGKFLKRREYHSTLPVSWETCAGQETTARMRHRKMDWFKIDKEYVKAVYCNPAYVTYIQSTSCNIPGLMNHKLELKLLEKYQQPQICWWHPNGRKQRWTKELLDKGERGELNSWLKTKHSEN